MPKKKDDGPLGLQSGPWSAFAKIVNPASYGKPAGKAKFAQGYKANTQEKPKHTVAGMGFTANKDGTFSKTKPKSGKMKPDAKPAAKKKGK